MSKHKCEGENCICLDADSSVCRRCFEEVVKDPEEFCMECEMAEVEAQEER